MDPKLLLLGLVVLLQLAGNVVVGYDNNNLANYWNEYRFVFGTPGVGTPTYDTEGVIPKNQYSTVVKFPIGPFGVEVTAVYVRVLARSRPVAVYDDDQKEVAINFAELGANTLSVYEITVETKPFVPNQ